MKTWTTLFLIGVSGMAAASACTVTTSDDGDLDAGSAGVDSGAGSDSGGSGGSGGSTGGKTGGGGGTGGSTGGAMTSGGSGGSTGGMGEAGTGDSGAANTGGTVTAYTCDDPTQGPTSTPLDSCEVDNPEMDPCWDCLMDQCCSELEACFGDGDVCLSGGPDGDGELYCVRSLLIDRFGQDEIYPNTDEFGQALSDCASPTCDLYGENTLGAASCMDLYCPEDCYFPAQ